MSGEPKVSVICTCYNKGKWIKQALDSIACQRTSFPIEIIVADDASTDESADIIEAFRAEHSDITTVITHEENEGIAATWLDACSLAKGAYIARLDGDDYWISETKLEAQVGLLESSDDSGWCNTDFDMIDTDGAIVCVGAFATGRITEMGSYEQMFAEKGLTNASTWLVDAQLMHEANSHLARGIADDTFGIQLDLFHMTKLSTIHESMCMLRVNEGSDSRPLTHEGAEKRFEGLKQQQFDYLERYVDVDYAEIIRRLLDYGVAMEVSIFDLHQIIGGLRGQIDAQHAIIEDLRGQVQGLQNSRNFVRPMKNAAKSVLSRK